MHNPLLGAELPAGDGVREFAARLSADQPGYLRDHVAMGQVVAPAAAYLEMLLAACDAVYGETRRPIEDLGIQSPLLLTGEPTEVRTRLRALPAGGAEAEIVSLVPGEPGRAVERRHVTARIGTPASPAATALTELATLLPAEADLAGGPTGAAGAELPADELYGQFVDLGMAYGPQFRQVLRVVRRGALAIGELRGQDTPVGEHLPPTVLDAALQTVLALADTDDPYLPVRVHSFQLLKKPMGTALRCVLRLAPVQPEQDTSVDLVLLEGDQVVCVLRGLGFRRVGSRQRQLYHEPRWVRRPAAAGAATAGTPEHAPARQVLVLGRTAADLAHLTDSATRAGVRLTAAAGPAEVAGVLAEQPTDVCWFWRPGSGAGTAAGTAAGADEVAGLRAECERNYRDLLGLLSVLEEAGFGRSQRLWLVTAGAHLLAGDPVSDSDLAAATLSGFGQTLRTEYPAYRPTMLDLPPGADDYHPLLAELLAAEEAESQVAYRDGQRYVRRLVRTEPTGGTDGSSPVDGEPAAPPVRVRPDRTYLVSGGLGALGLATAEKLVALGARHIALVGRRAVPCEQVAELATRLGAETAVYAGDVGNAADVDRITAAVRQLQVPVGGIVHAAGVLDDTPISGLSWDRLDAVFGAKVYGSVLLHRAAAGFGELDFFVGYSSIAAVLGPPAQASYAAGNAFLDGLMHRRAARGLPGTSVNWGPWAGAGMSAGLRPDLVARIAAQGVGFLRPATGLRALAGLLAAPRSTPPQLMVGDLDWGRLVSGLPAANALYDEVAPRRAAGASRIDLAALSAQPAADRQAAIVAAVREAVSRVLRFEPDEVEPDAEFVALGLDSLAAVALKNDLEASFGIPLPASITFDHPSGRLLAGYLDQQVAPEPDRSG